uniref:DNA (cytosine-5-)-methyltransferase n=1 Tax=viral metagenome TaxID=1070528 RepID=A0A6M3LA02_9ZZZZ
MAFRHLDLFSGIGGFAYAAQQVWDDDYECVGFVEIDPFCQAVLKLRFPGVPIHDDIKTFGGEQGEPIGEESRIDLLTGGFPCQPFSAAGLRRGKADNRWLWKDMLRVIQEVRPSWIIAENVYGLLTMQGGLVFDEIISDMENEGYEVQPFIIPACAKNAPHRRDRVWIIGNATETRLQKSPAEEQQESVQDAERRNRTDVNNTAIRSEDQEREIQEWQNAESNRSDSPDRGDAQNSRSQRSSRRSKDSRQILECESTETENTGSDFLLWNIDWRDVALATCHDRVDDGISARLDGLELSAAKHRMERIKALGNAIVPQVAMEIMKGIKYAEQQN